MWHKKVSLKYTHVCVADQMLEGGFVVKAGGFKSRPSLLYLGVQIRGRYISCLVNTGAMQSFMSPKLAKELGFTGQKGKQVHQCAYCKR
jgi:hypothetical protein